MPEQGAARQPSCQRHSLAIRARACRRRLSPARKEPLSRAAEFETRIALTHAMLIPHALWKAPSLALLQAIIDAGCCDQLFRRFAARRCCRRVVYRARLVWFSCLSDLLMMLPCQTRLICRNLLQNYATACHYDALSLPMIILRGT